MSPGLGLLPFRCGACGQAGPSPCADCRLGLRPAPPIRSPAPLQSVAALVRYEGPACRLVLGIKARHERSAVGWLAEGMALLVPDGADLLTWAPTDRSRAAHRGVDHARLLALAVARRTGIRAHATLSRLPGPAQHGRSRADRLAHGPSFAARYALDGLVVVVVDDVTTTGATLVAAGRAVVAGGAAEVHGVAAAAA
jgi:predicted amidophosphoribosyltransferase